MTDGTTPGRDRRGQIMIHRSVIAVALVLSIVLLAAPAASQEADASSGVVVSVTGDVLVERSDGQESVSEGFVLMGGDTIIVRTGARCSGFTPQGENFALTGPSEFQLPSGSEGGLVDNVASWIQSQLADWVGESKRRPLTTRGVRDWVITSEAPAMIMPAPGGAVRPGEPELHWGTVSGVDAYELTIAPAFGDEIVRTVRGNTATVEELESGAEYVWRVSPAVDGWAGHGNWREFRVLGEAEEEQLDAAIATMDDLEAGVLLLSMGLHDEAIYRFDAATDSGDSERSARLWRSQALADCGLHKEAYEDLIQVRGLE